MKGMEMLQLLKVDQSSDPAVSTLNIKQKGIKSVCRDSYISVFTAALFTTEKKSKEPKYPPTGEEKIATYLYIE